MFRKKLLRLFDLIFLVIIFVNQILKPTNLFNLHEFKYFQKTAIVVVRPVNLMKEKWSASVLDLKLFEYLLAYFSYTVLITQLNFMLAFLYLKLRKIVGI